MRNKPIRFGLKLWAICGISVYIFYLDIHCGKKEVQENTKLSNSTLGTKAVMKMLHELLATTSKDKLAKYHIYFDNFFSSPDLLVHLKKLGLKATGTVQEDRVYEMKKDDKIKEKREKVKMELEKKSPRGTCKAKHDEIFGKNYIFVIDIKCTSFICRNHTSRNHATKAC